MKKLMLILVAAAAPALVAGCGSSAPKDKLEALVESCVSPDGLVDVPGSKKLLDAATESPEQGQRVVAMLLERAKTAKKARQLSFAHILARVEVEPARFEAAKELLKHPMRDVRLRAVDALGRGSAPDEANELAMELAQKDPDPFIRSAACRTISFTGKKKYNEEICKLLLTISTTDADQTVREHAQRGIDRMKAARLCR